jgi:membrane fusion protein, copper/silver efflux system
MRISPGLMTFIVGLALLGIAGVWYQHSLARSGALAPAQASAPAAPAKYACPMRCVETDKPGKCPVCGMDLAQIEGAAPAATAPASTGPAMYVCPMHSQVEQDHPGTCPICGMELVPEQPAAGGVDSATGELVSAVKLSPLQSVLANAVAVHPEYDTVTAEFTAIGEVKVPEDRVRELVSWQEGRVDNLLVLASGGEVAEGEHLLDIYSEELVAAQEEYLLARQALTGLGQSGYDSVAASTRRLVDASRQKLQRLGLSDQQLASLDESGQVEEHVAISARFGGTVLDKMVNEGDCVMQGERLFTVADLSTVWVEVQVFESDMAALSVGQHVKLDCPIHPGMVFHGAIDLIEPSLDAETRTHRVRVSVANPDRILRPGMILDAQLTVSHSKRLLLPRNAVLHTGEGDLAYVLVGEGQWEPRRITVGLDFGDRVEITGGLTPKDAVAATAVFLLDSEAQVKGVPRPVDAPALPGPAQLEGADG